MNVFWILPLIILFGGAMVIALLGRFARKVTPGWNISFAIIANLCLLATLGLIIAFGNGLPVDSSELTLVLPGRTLENSLYTVFRLDSLTWWFMLVFVVLGSIVAIYSIKYMDRDSRLDRYYLLLLILVGGMIGVVMSGDLLTLFIFWEGMSISSYVLVAFRKDEPEPIEAGIKYLFMSAFGSVILLFGMSLLYGITGTLNIAAISSALTTDITTGSGFSGIHVVIIICLIVGFGVKAAIVPLHLWLPDAHPAAPSGISAMLSGVVIMTGMFAMTNTLTSFFGGSVSAPGNNLKVVGYVLLWVAVITMIVGNLMALRQKDLKRMLAFSTILNVGFILFGLSMTLTTIGADIVNLSVQGSYFHIFTHSLGKGLAFLCAGAILYRFHDRNIDRLEGIGQKMPITTFALTIALLSLAGVPPLPGFWSKLNIVVAAVTSGDIQFRIGVVFFLLSSVISVVYYLIILQKFWFKPAGEHLNEVKETPIEIVIPLVVIVLMMVVISVLPGTFENLANNAANALLG